MTISLSGNADLHAIARELMHAEAHCEFIPTSRTASPRSVMRRATRLHSLFTKPGSPQVPGRSAGK